MKLIAVMALVVIGATAWPVGQSKAEKADGPSGKTEEIQELHNKLIQAQLNGDIAALDRIWADDHIFTNPLGVVQTKAQRLAEIQSGNRKLEHFRVTDVQVRVYGDTAVVTSRAMLKGQRQGQDISGQFRGIDVDVKKQGSWQWWPRKPQASLNHKQSTGNHFSDQRLSSMWIIPIGCQAGVPSSHWLSVICSTWVPSYRITNSSP
jgi:ketosteroid isomerase-like protein